MSEEKVIHESEFDRSEQLDKKVDSDDNPLKEFIVNYVGVKRELEETVTVEDIVMVFAEEFPEFLLALAEENFFRGYKQALKDLDDYNKNSQPEEQNQETVSA